VWNRTAAKAVALADQTQSVAVEKLGDVLALLAAASCTLDVILCTVPPAARLLVPSELLGSAPVVLDAAYLPRTTSLSAQALAAGCPVVRGIEMLVAQGVAQSALWTGKQPPLEKIEEAVMRYYDSVSRDAGSLGVTGAEDGATADSEIRRIDAEIQRMVQMRTLLLQRAVDRSGGAGSASSGDERNGGVQALQASHTPLIDGPVPSAAMRAVLESVDTACAVGRPKASTREKQVAFCGGLGSFAHTAALRLMASSGLVARLVPCSTVQDVFAQVESGRVDGGVVMLESSRAGVDH